MKVEDYLVVVGLLAILPSLYAQKMDNQRGPQNCAKVPVTICSDLKGRTSDYSTPQNLPSDIRLDNRSVVYSNFTLTYILEKTQSPKACSEFVLHLLCQVVAPPCNPQTSTPLLLCPETCLAHKKLISSGLCDDFLANVNDELEINTLPEFVALAEYFAEFNCSDPATYFQNSITMAECNSSFPTCTNLFSPNTQESILTKDSLYSCEPLTSSSCKLMFPTAFEYAILIPGRRSNEDDVFEVLGGIFPLLSEMCQEWLNLIACSYLHPSCNENGELRGLCEGDCDKIATVVHQRCNLEEKITMSNFTVMNQFLMSLMRLNCSNPESYLIPTIPVEQTSCFSVLDLLDSNDSATKLSARTISIIVAGAISGVLVLMLTVAVTFLCTRTGTRLKMRKILPSQDILRYLSFSQSLTLQQLRQNSRTAVSQLNTMRTEGNGASEGSALQMFVAEQQRRQFAGSIVLFNSLKMDSCIGQGSFGKVYSGTMDIDGESTTVAIKTIKFINSEEELHSFLEESLIMKDFKHPNILGLLGVCFDTPNRLPYIILPFMVNGSVKTYLRAKRVHPTNFDNCPVGLKFAHLVQMCMDVAEGMKYLADNKFVHRDLAARNCMVNEEGLVLVGDFGLARDIYAAEYYRSSRQCKVPVKWMAPEALNDGISNEKTDIWSYGVTCWEVFSLGRSPYPGIENHEILQHISTGGRLNKPTLCPDTLYTMLTQCWAALPEDRPSFTDLCTQLKEYWDDEHLYVVQSFK